MVGIMKSQIQTLNSTSLDLFALKELYRSCKWDWIEPETEMSAAFRGSFRLYGYWIDEQLVGFGRIISDGQIYGLLVDFMVHPEFRRRGIGKALLESIVNDCQKAGLKVIQLLASREGLLLYEKMGFAICPSSSPGMVKFLAVTA